ncbi:actin-related protein 8 [Arctopsyche grandis]|uniref:actin-related protein 8 n=1 Tax=Arctopsyche grandis TaxID=121162 RepID=UPI00406D978C
MPVHQETDPEQQHFPTQNIIVIQPGSLHIRIGRASDLVPVKSLHCVARKRNPGGLYHRDPFIPPALCKTKECIDELEQCRLQVSHTLQTCVQSNGTRRYATPPQQIAAFNRRSVPEKVSDASEWPSIEEDIVVGDRVLELNPDLPYNIHFPYKRGDFNLHPGIGGSLTSILTDIADIWKWVIQYKLGIQLSELEKYRCVLLVPDIYNRSHLKHLVSLSLNELRFGHCFLVQESVGATFGAGVGYACVVDIGDQKTAVSCIEDGMSHKTTRLRMDYGAGDACQTLSWLLKKSSFPYAHWNEESPQDVMLMRSLFQDFCHVNVDICGPQEKIFVVNKPGRDSEKITLQVGDECLIAPLALFTTDLLLLTGPKNTRTQMIQGSDYEDPFDAEYLRETGRKRENVDTGGPSDAVAGTEGATGESQQSVNPDEDIVVDALDQTGGEGLLLAPGQVLGIDVAILQSIERCPNDELKKKMYNCILIVGGGVKLQGLAKWLQNKLSLQIPYMYKTEQLDIVVSPKDTDPSTTAWKGAAIMSCLESANELWVNRAEWQKFGVKILRERSPFIW